MGPDPKAPATAGEVEASAEATIAAAAVTLETLHEAIESEAEVSEERQTELLKEVRECRTKLETLSNSIVGVESPAMQQLLVQMGQLQTSLEAIQADLATLAGADEENTEESASEVVPVVPGTSSVPNASPSSEKGENGTSKSEGQSSTNKPPESNQSATPPPPRKKRYVKI